MFYRVAISVLILTMLLPWFTPAFSASGACSECASGVCLLGEQKSSHSGVCTMHSVAHSDTVADDSHGSAEHREHARDAHAAEPQTGDEMDAEQMTGAEMDGRDAASHEEASHEKTASSHSSNDRCRAATSISCATGELGPGLEEIAPSEPHLLTLFVPTKSAEHELHRALFFVTEFISSDPTAIDRPPNNPTV